MASFEHTSVLLEEAVDGLAVRPDGIYLDGTLGGGGHSAEIAKRLTEGGCLIGFDQDAEAIAAATERLAEYADRVTVIRDNFVHAADRLKEMGVDAVDGILLDLGVSSRQFDAPERGFSYRTDAPLDMRMDRDQTLTAADIVNEWPERDIAGILRDYGEERFAQAIAARIAAARKEAPIRTTGDLNRLVDEAIPLKIRRKDAGHPARKTYQALRIACNRELEVLEEALPGMMELLKPGGRLAVITFHSLEDRIVKNLYRNWEHPCTCPPEFPVCVCGKKPRGRNLTRKPVTPGEEELENNRRARSAKLRIFEKG